MANGSCGHTPYDRDQVSGCIICAQAEIERLQKAATGFEIATQRLAIERDACLRRLDENDDEIERLRAEVGIKEADYRDLNARVDELLDERFRAWRPTVETSTLLPNAARSHKPGPRCDGNNCKGHPFNCYGHPYDCGCSAEETAGEQP